MWKCRINDKRDLERYMRVVKVIYDWDEPDLESRITGTYAPGFPFYARFNGAKVGYTNSIGAFIRWEEPEVNPCISADGDGHFITPAEPKFYPMGVKLAVEDPRGNTYGPVCVLSRLGDGKMGLIEVATGRLMSRPVVTEEASEHEVYQMAGYHDFKPVKYKFPWENFTR